MRKAILIALGAALVALLAFGGLAATGAADGTMHNCPQDGKWAISVWAGDEADAGEALGTCGNIEVAYALTPTGAWERYIPGVPEVNTLKTIEQYQGVIALGGPAVPVAEPETNVTVIAPLPADCTINDLTMATWWGGQSRSSARTGLHTEPPTSVDDQVATFIKKGMRLIHGVCFYCGGEFVVCADTPGKSGNDHIYTITAQIVGDELVVLPREHEYIYYDCGKRDDGTTFMCRLSTGSQRLPFNPTCPNDAWTWDERDPRGFWCEGYPDAVFGAHECGPDQEPEPGTTYCVR